MTWPRRTAPVLLSTRRASRTDLVRVLLPPLDPNPRVSTTYRQRRRSSGPWADLRAPPTAPEGTCPNSPYPDVEPEPTLNLLCSTSAGTTSSATPVAASPTAARASTHRIASTP